MTSLCHRRKHCLTSKNGVAVLAAVVGALGTATDLPAQDWNPFPEPEVKRPSRNRDAAVVEPDSRPFLPPIGGQLPRTGPLPPGKAPRGLEAVVRDPLPPLDEKSRAILDRDELAPVAASDGTGLPLELWRGLDLAAIEGLFGSLEIPPRSPAIASLWRRLIVSDAMPSGGGDTDPRFLALRVEALTRSGLLKEAGEAAATMPGGSAEPLAALLTARTEVALGRRETACDAIKAARHSTGLPRTLKTDALLIGGYCAITGGNTAAAGLTAELLREQGAEGSGGLVAFDAIAAGEKPDIRAVKRISPVEYRLIELAGGADQSTIVEKASPAVVAALAQDRSTGAERRTVAGEAAIKLNAIAPLELAEIYRQARVGESADALLPRAAKGYVPAKVDTARPGLTGRVELFNAAEAERTPLKKARLIRAFLDDARRAGLYLPALEMMATAAATVTPAVEIGWFAETAIEVALAAKDYERARTWVRFAAGADPVGSDARAGPLGHWLALADIADSTRSAGRGESLASVEELALRGRFGADLLHRLAAVLDALDYNVPIPLWEAASRTPQPAGGHLPETGVLSELLDASKKKEFGHTVLIAMKAMGPNGAEGAHMIALGDSIRALKRAGLEPDARRLGFEALFASWPRSAAY